MLLTGHHEHLIKDKRTGNNYKTRHGSNSVELWVLREEIEMCYRDMLFFFFLGYRKFPKTIVANQVSNVVGCKGCNAFPIAKQLNC